MNVTAQQAAAIWMKVHSPQEWRALIDQYERVAVLPTEVTGFLATTTTGTGSIWSQLSTGDPKGLARFAEAFIANVSRALDR